MREVKPRQMGSRAKVSLGKVTQVALVPHSLAWRGIWGSLWQLSIA